MIFKYQSGEEINRGDQILLHGQPGHIEIVATELGNPETDWFVQEYGGGVMVVERAAGLTFIPADQIDECDDLRFVSRAETPA